MPFLMLNANGTATELRGRDVVPRLARADDGVCAHPDRHRHRDAQLLGREMLFLFAIAAGVALSFAGTIIRVVRVVSLVGLYRNQENR